MNKIVKIGLIQENSLIGDVEKNLSKAIKLIEDISRKGAQIACLPELFLTGYDMDNKYLYSKEFFMQYDKLIIEELTRVSKTNNIYVILPVLVIKYGMKYNSAIFFDNKGRIIGSYDKTHLFENERRVFDRGGSLKVWDTEIGKIGIMICYDAGFPEVSRILKLKGAEIVFCPSAWRIQDKEIWDINILQRAIENRMFVVGVNSVTKTSKLHLFGCSKVVSPEGKVVCEIGIDKEESVICEVDLDMVYKYTSLDDYLKDRRPELYDIITEINVN